MSDRNLYGVCERLLTTIPETETGVRADIVRVQNAVIYTAPELMHERWRLLCHYLNCALPYPPETDWQWCVAMIMKDCESVDECKRIVTDELTKEEKDE